jgi:hypothetical protein
VENLEALEILGRYDEAREPSAYAEAKTAAALKLLADVEAFDKKLPNLRTQHVSNDTIAVNLFTGGVLVQYNVRNMMFAVRAGGDWSPVPLAFNPARGTFEGRDADRATPTPGEPKDKRRDALAVIAEAMVKAMGAE